MPEESLSDVIRRLIGPFGPWWSDDLEPRLKCLLQKEDLFDRVEKLASKNEKTGDTLLHAAAKKGKKNMIKIIMDCINCEHEASQLLKLTDKCGSTPIHSAVQSGDIEVLEAMINQVKNCGMFSVLLGIQNGSGNTALHRAAQSGSKAMVETMLDLLTNQQQSQLLGIKNNYGQTAMESARKQKNPVMIQCLSQYSSFRRQLSDSWSQPSWNADEQGSSPTDIRSKLLECIQNGEEEQFAELYRRETETSELRNIFVENGGEVFHKLLKRCLTQNQASWRDVLRDVYQRLTGDLRLQLLLRTDLSGRNPIRRCIKYKNTTLIRILLAALSPSQAEQVICQTDTIGFNCIHDGAFTGGFDTLRVVLHRLSAERKVDILIEDSRNTWIELGFGNPEKLDDLLGTDNSALWLRLISATNDHGCNAIHILVESGHFAFLQYLLDKLCAGNKQAVIESFDNLGYTALDLSLQQLSDSGSKLTEILLGSLEAQAAGSLMTNCSDKPALLRHIIRSQNNQRLIQFLRAVNLEIICREIPNITKEEALTTSQLDILDPLVSHYIIPTNQERAKKVAFICYSSENRDGAVSEAIRLNEAFIALGFHVLTCQWRAFDMLQNWIGDQLRQLGNKISLLFVCTMSHGFRGHILGEGGSKGEITNLIHKVQHNIPARTPLVMLIQACQNSDRLRAEEINPSQDRPDVYDRSNSRHITLKRANTVLLLATIAGRLAVRGAYTGAIADELIHADGVRDIHDMHQSAVHSLQANPDPDISLMVPEYRESLRKRLIIPAAHLN